MNIQIVYMTFGSLEEARSTARHLVQAHLAACANIFENVNAVYLWEGRLQDEREVVVIAKTAGHRLAELIEAVRRMHRYEVPCIVAWPATGGHPPFLDWVAAETGQTASEA
jgi:periplasmic divalent cation tolerance protein